MKRFEGKTILVTGSSRGIGAAIATRLAHEGAKVGITYSSNGEAAERILAALPGEGHLLLNLNVSNEESVTAAFEQIALKWGHLDGLVNNAGITRDTLLLRMRPEDFSAVIDTNLKGTYLCTRAAVKMMLKARQGSIVNITSVIGEMGNAGQANYAASKAGVEGFTKSIAQEVGSRMIRVNCVAPGFIVTDMTDAMNEQQKTAILSKVPLGTLGDSNDVALATAFLLSNESKYITGHVLSVNGGLYM
ncbi:MAG: 3-oxoacyl-[acyl-carrier-protein] reductase [Bdellovibrionota bacterium]